ncbi:MAG: hypothetical protein ACJ8EL_11250 [Rhizomicrobium sp.]|jgi:hypothetical protein
MLRGIVFLAVVLAACSQKPAWKDASGQGRSYVQASADDKACVDAGTKGFRPTAAGAQLPNLESCMALKGWQRVTSE